MGPKLRTTLPTACFSVGWSNMAGWAGLTSGWGPPGGREPKRKGKLFALRNCTSGPWPTLQAPGSDHKGALPLYLTGTNVKGDLSPTVEEAPGSSRRRSSHFPSCRTTGIRLWRPKDSLSKRRTQPFSLVLPDWLRRKVPKSSSQGRRRPALQGGLLHVPSSVRVISQEGVGMGWPGLRRG